MILVAISGDSGTATRRDQEIKVNSIQLTILETDFVVSKNKRSEPSFMNLELFGMRPWLRPVLHGSGSGGSECGV